MKNQMDGRAGVAMLCNLSNNELRLNLVVHLYVPKVFNSPRHVS